MTLQTHNYSRPPLPLPGPSPRKPPTQISQDAAHYGKEALHSLGKFSRFMLARPDLLLPDANLATRLRRSYEVEMRSGLRILLIGAAIVAVWGGIVPLASAVVLPGSLVSESNLKKVQHPTGGVIAKIAAHDGDLVKAGDLLVRLDETAAGANLQVVVGQLDAIRARLARLLAERDEADDMTLPKEITERMGDKEVAALVAAERSLFRARKISRQGQKELLVGRIGQLEEEIRGLDAQMKSQASQRELIVSELQGVETLYKKQLVPLTRLTTLQREAARLDGAQGQLVSTSAETHSKIDEARLQVARLDQDFRAEVMKDLRDSQDKEAELVERQIAAQDQLKRIDIRAPTSGVVHQLTVHTIGGVISPGEVLMEIVPEKDELQIEAHLATHDIDQAHVGQPTQVRLSAFNQRTTPELEGKVNFVSADTTRDTQGGAAYYVVRVTLSRDEISRLGALQLVPGMPAEVFLQTGSRTMISYLFKPIADQFSRVFRER